MKPTREMVKERLKALEGQATKVAVLEAWDGLDAIDKALQVPAAEYVPSIPEAWTFIEFTKAKIYRALGGDA